MGIAGVGVVLLEWPEVLQQSRSFSSLDKLASSAIPEILALLPPRGKAK